MYWAVVNRSSPRRPLAADLLLCTANGRDPQERMHMRMDGYGKASLAAAALLLLGSVGMSQSAAGSKPEPHNQASVQQSGGGARNSKPAAPIYKDNHNTGTNPLYESKDATVRRKKPGGSQVQYKDHEDMMTRYRPGNNKTTAVKSSTPQGGTSRQGATPPPQ
jgi:hypothetical protein